MAATNDIITCKYLPIYFGKQFRFYPMVSIFLESSFKTETVALIDSGSTNTFVPWDLAEAIGLTNTDTKKLKTAETTGAAGKFKATIIPLKRMGMMKGRAVFEIFRDLQVYVPSKDAAPLPHVILGRDYIFKRFDVSFCENGRKMRFQRR